MLCSLQSCVIYWTEFLSVIFKKPHVFIMSCRKLGWESVPGEIHLNTMLRGDVYKALATFGHDKTHSEAMQRFESLLKDSATPLLSADIRKVKHNSK